MRKSFVITAPNGLGSRVSAALVFEANKFDCDLTLIFANEKADLKSIMSVMALVIRQGESFAIEANGKDEKEALEYLERYMRKTSLI